MKKQISLLLFSLFTTYCLGQFDAFGIKSGIGLSNQYVHIFTWTPGDYSYWNDNKVGWSAQLFGEKKFGNHLVLQPAIGYIQKGYSANHAIIHSIADSLTVKSDQVVLHYFSIDLTARWVRNDWRLKPYLIGGLQFNRILGNRQVLVRYLGETYEMAIANINGYNKFTLGAVVGIGIHLGKYYFLDFEFNPDLTKCFKDDVMLLSNQYAGITVGIYLDDFNKKRSTKSNQQKQTEYE